MKKIFEQYGGVITSAIAIVALIGVIALMFAPGGTGWMDTAFNGVISNFSEKANTAIDGAGAAPSEKIGVGLNVFDNTMELETGILNADGTKNPGTYSAYRTTVDYMAVKPSQIYTISYLADGASGTWLSGFRAYCFYDKNKEFISGWSDGVNLPHQIVTPENCYYIRFSFPVNNLPNMYISEGNYKPSLGAEYAYEYRTLPSVQEPEMSSLQGKTILGVGDSITQADGCEAGWLMRTANNLGMIGKNQGINGSTIAVKESNPTDRTPLVTRYEDMPDADIVMVLGGSNDWYYAWTSIGTFEDRTNYTFYGALHNYIIGLKEKYDDSLIVFCTPIKRSNSNTLQNSLGMTLSQYCDIIKEVCEYYDIPVIDCYNNVPLDPSIEEHNNQYFSTPPGSSTPDYTHPNDLGHKIMADYITEELKSLIN